MDRGFQPVLFLEAQSPPAALKQYHKIIESLRIPSTPLRVVSVACPILAALLTYYTIQWTGTPHKGWVGLFYMAVVMYAPILWVYLELMNQTSFAGERHTPQQRRTTFLAGLFMLVFNNFLLILFIVLLSAIVACPFGYLLAWLLQLGMDVESWPRSIFWGLMAPVILIVFLYYTSDVPFMDNLFSFLLLPASMSRQPLGSKWRYRLALSWRVAGQVIAGVRYNFGMILEVVGFWVLGIFLVSGGPVPQWLELYYGSLLEGVLVCGLAGWLLGEGMARNLTDWRLRAYAELGRARCYLRLNRFNQASVVLWHVNHFALRSQPEIEYMAGLLSSLVEAADHIYPLPVRREVLAEAQKTLDQIQEFKPAAEWPLWRAQVNQASDLFQFIAARLSPPLQG